MVIRENISLRNNNTFGIDIAARYFSAFSHIEDLEKLPVDDRSVLVLGGGSNLLFTHDYPGLVLKNEVLGVDLVHEDDDYVYVRAGGGENWHSFVMHCVSNDYAGVENLSLIPGNVGAAPIQNIGAYGVELESVFWNLEAFHLRERKMYTFTRSDCEFGYRDSVFKNRFRNEFVITHVCFRLRKKPVFHTSYGAIGDQLSKAGVKDISIRAISEAVIAIRRSKLPDPAEIGNAGSFFKNPTVPKTVFESLEVKHPGIVGYANIDGSVKLAAGWLIEHCGPDETTSWKGYREGDAGCHARQALVLVNYGNATGKQIYELSDRIIKSVKGKFNVQLEREVNII